MRSGYNIIGTIATRFSDRSDICLGRYRGSGSKQGARALILNWEGEYGIEEEWIISVNLAPYGVSTADDEILIKTWSENEQIIDPLLMTGLFEDTERRAPTGYTMAHVWRLSRAALALTS